MKRETNKKNLSASVQGILIAPGELFLKSEGVKRIFKKKLVQNIGFFLKKNKIDFSILSFRGRIFIKTKNPKKAIRIIKNVFGISWLADCIFLPGADLKQVSEFIDQNYKKWIKKNETFALKLKNDSNLNRNKIIDTIAKNIKRKVDLSSPKKQIFIENRKNGWFIYFKKIKGNQGLPVGTSGKSICLMSGGIDSPVASYLIAKRGTENIWIHFHSFPLVSKASIDKVKDLTKIFLKYQPRLKVYFAPFHKAQMQIKVKCPAKYRILLYRRLMLKISEQIAKKENCEALITGESLGQVSSQTLPNINIIQEKIKIPIFRPLIEMDKSEIIDLAKKIKTYKISIKPHEDCCTLFTPKSATAKGNMEIVKQLERKLDIKKMIQQALKKVEIEQY